MATGARRRLHHCWKNHANKASPSHVEAERVRGWHTLWFISTACWTTHLMYPTCLRFYFLGKQIFLSPRTMQYKYVLRDSTGDHIADWTVQEAPFLKCMLHLEKLTVYAVFPLRSQIIEWIFGNVTLLRTLFPLSISSSLVVELAKVKRHIIPKKNKMHYRQTSLNKNRYIQKIMNIKNTAPAGTHAFLDSLWRRHAKEASFAGTARMALISPLHENLLLVTPPSRNEIPSSVSSTWRQQLHSTVFCCTKAVWERKWYPGTLWWMDVLILVTKVRED